MIVIFHIQRQFKINYTQNLQHGTDSSPHESTRQMSFPEIVVPSPACYTEHDEQMDA